MKNEPLEIEDEWDTHSICNQILDKGAMMIHGFVPGTGKSFLGETSLFYSLFSLLGNFKQKKLMQSLITNSSQYQWR